jgi:hypothetical protein
MIDYQLLLDIYNHLCGIITFALYLTIFIGVISSRPAKRKKRSGGSWIQDDSRGK